MKGDYQKSLKKLTLLFLLNPVPFSGQSYQKQKGPGTTDQLPFRLRNKFTKISFLVIYYISDQVWWYNIKWFLSYSKNYTCQLMQAVSWYHKFSASIFPFESWKSGKEVEKLQKYEYLENEKGFLDEVKNIFHSFEGLSFAEKIKIQ